MVMKISAYTANKGQVSEINRHVEIIKRVFSWANLTKPPKTYATMSSLLHEAYEMGCQPALKIHKVATHY
ncbi:MAG: hypothetical protein IMZ53_00735 [Thermoplasmata archaeon]|nr:hypothetical protein [Thermoplasmata archaeon]